VSAIRVLIVDDSRMIREVLTHILSEHSDIEVVGAAADAYEARDLIRELRPDVVTLDVEMPKMNGLEFLDRLMRARPTPVVMISSFTERGSEVTFRALELGAVEFVTKPKLNEETPDDYGRLIADKIRAAARARLRPPRRVVTAAAAVVKRPVPRGVRTADCLIAVGASTGGTEALREFLVGMPEDCPGILIVQHMPENFTRMFAERLNGLCRITVKEAEHNDPVLPGHAYVAPGGKHLWVKRDEGQLLAKLSTEPPMNLHRPSVDFLFLSVARYVGADAAGVIMTGMGRDGTEGVRALKRQPDNYCVVQSRETCVVAGMPDSVLEHGLADEVQPLEGLAARIAELTRR
jgi:two-component system chemotaxis response regulator CheB